MVRIARRFHHPLGKRVLLAERVVKKEVGGVDLSFLVVCTCGRVLDPAAEEVLDVVLFRAQSVDGPAGEEARVVLCYLLYVVSSRCWA